MTTSPEKCVLLLDPDQPAGLLANTAAILGMSLGKMAPELIGVSLPDAQGYQHAGIIQIPVPVLKASAEVLLQICQRLGEPAYEKVTCFDFSELARSCRTYEEYEDKLAASSLADLRFAGLLLAGPKKAINSLCGSLPLLR